MSSNEFLVKNWENPDCGKVLIWSWKVMEKSRNFTSEVSWEPCITMYYIVAIIVSRIFEKGGGLQTVK